MLCFILLCESNISCAIFHYQVVGDMMQAASLVAHHCDALLILVGVTNSAVDSSLPSQVCVIVLEPTCTHVCTHINVEFPFTHVILI